MREPSPSRPAERRRDEPPRLLRLVAWLYGIYYLVTGVWPTLHLPSFEAITGEKTDDWLVRCVGGLVAVVGLVVLRAARARRIGSDVVVLAVGAALVLTAVDVIYVADGTLRPVYLLDAAAEVVLVGGWIIGWRSRYNA
jgi:hypothetical protein